MIYEVLSDSPSELSFTTHWRAQRGRGVLFATTPLVVYLLVMGFLFFLATRDLSIWSKVKEVAKVGFGISAVAAAICFALGYRIRETVRVSVEGIDISRRGAWGQERLERLTRGDLAGLAIDPSLRSLGADVLLVAVDRQGKRLAIAEGEPHTGQVRDLAQKMVGLLTLDLEPPRFTH